MVAYIAVNRRWWGGQFGTLAACEAAFMGSMVVTSLFVGKLKIVRPGLSFVFGMAVIGLTVAFMAFSRPYGWFVLWNVVCGVAFPFATIPLSTYIQLSVPDAFRGRVNAANSMVSQAIRPISLGAAGMLLDRIGLTPMFLLMGIGFGCTALAGLMDAGFRNARMPVAAHNDSPAQEAQQA